MHTSAQNYSLYRSYLSASFLMLPKIDYEDPESIYVHLYQKQKQVAFQLNFG